MNEPYMRRRHLPPSEPETFAGVVPAGQTVVAAEMRRHAWNGVIVYAQSDVPLRVILESGTEFGGSIIWTDRRIHGLAAGPGAPAIACWTAAEWIRVSLENPGEGAAETVRVASYLSSVGTIPRYQKPLTTLWEGYVVAPASGDHYTAPIDLTSVSCSRYYLRKLNGSTGPSNVGSAAIQVSPDGEHWHDEKSLTVGGATANLDHMMSHALYGESRFARIRYGGNTGQPVTLWAWANVAYL